MNRSHTIREWMKANEGPKRPAQVRVALGLTRQQANVALSDMAKAGILTFTGEPGRRLYDLARDVPPPLTPEERKSHLAESRRKCRAKRLADGRDEAYRRSKGVKPRADYLAERKAVAAKRAEAKTLKLKRLKIAKTPKPSSEFRAKLHASVQAAMAAKAKPAQRAATTLTAHFAKAERTISVERETETVEQFMARGGMVDRLPPGAGNSLRVLGVDL